MSLFQTKKPIAPVLEGMVDMHNHLLPGLDDGAKNIDESLAMVEAYQRLSINTVIASPHVMEGNYPNTPQSIKDSHEHLTTVLNEKGIAFEVKKAAGEYMLEEHFEHLLAKDAIITLQGKYVLVEMSYFQPPINLEQLIFKIQHKGFIPVLAHPERYNFYKKETPYENLLSLGCKFQLNLLALSKHYGEHVQKKAFRFLKKDWYTFIGTDAHHDKHIKKIGSLTLKPSLLKKVKALVTNNQSEFR